MPVLQNQLAVVSGNAQPRDSQHVLYHTQAISCTARCTLQLQLTRTKSTFFGSPGSLTLVRLEDLSLNHWLWCHIYSWNILQQKPIFNVALKSRIQYVFVIVHSMSMRSPKASLIGLALQHKSTNTFGVLWWHDCIEFINFSSTKELSKWTCSTAKLLNVVL